MQALKDPALPLLELQVKHSRMSGAHSMELKQQEYEAHFQTKFRKPLPIGYCFRDTCSFC